MKIAHIDLDKEILVVAEVGNNHEGSYALAEELIGLAAQAGAGAVKFQTIVPEKLVSVANRERIQQLKKFQLSYAQFENLKKVADQEKILFLSTPFDIESAIFLNQLVPAFKIASGDNDFFPMIKVVAETGKPIILSSGLANFNEIKRSKEYIENVWKTNDIKQELAILHCVVSYPTAKEEVNLRFIRALQRLGVTVGYSDHTIGIESAVLSSVMGAKIIEKHFTKDKAYSDFHDHKLSADPQELSELVNRVRSAEIMLGSDTKTPDRSELANLEKVRRSIVAARFLPAGSRVLMEDLCWTRPRTGLKPGEENKIIGRVLKNDIQAGGLILEGDMMD